MMKNIYSPVEAVIEDIITETQNIKTFVIRPKVEFSFRTGQFIELTLPGIGEAPFTPSSDPNVKEKIDVTIMNVGKVTQRLHNAAKNTPVGIRGPYGKGYPLEQFAGKDILIVGGGVGLAPLRSLLFSLFADIEKYNKVVLCYGARTPPGYGLQRNNTAVVEDQKCGSQGYRGCGRTRLERPCRPGYDYIEGPARRFKECQGYSLRAADHDEICQPQTFRTGL